MSIQNTPSPNLCRLLFALVLCEPNAAAIAACDLYDDLEVCLKYHIIPGQHSRVPELYRVLLAHVLAQASLDISTVVLQALAQDVLVDAPRAVQCFLNIANGRSTSFMNPLALASGSVEAVD